jgi:anaerobic magnesium-protoporphyrin IX monomethyl ester cyclase
MQVVLINSPLFHDSIHSHEDSLPPLGLGYIATQIQNIGIKVELIDAVNENISLPHLLERLTTIRPEYIAINIFTTNYLIVKELLTSINFQTHFIIGGPATKHLHNKIISWETKNFIDIVIGDGELIIVDLLNNRIKESAIIESPQRRVYSVDRNSSYFVHDISNIPLNRDLFSIEPILNIYGKREINIITSRGCIYNCSFCASARKLNSEYPVRERSSISVISELLEIRSKYPGCNSIRILDDLFLKNSTSIDDAIMIFTKFNFQWRSMAHIGTFNHIEQSKINALKASGCKEIFIGIESGSPIILRSINKTSDTSLIKLTLTRLFRAGINVKAYFIYGFPDENINDMELTYNLAFELKNLSLKYNVSFRTSVFQFRPYHGTKIYAELKKKYPDIDNQQITYNETLSSQIGREQYNFHSNNFSKVSLNTIHDYICRTNNLNGQKTIFKSIPNYNRRKYTKEV